MRVGSATRAGGPAAAGAPAAKPGSAFSLHVAESTPARGPSGASGPAGVVALEAVLVLQELADGPAKRRNAVRRGHDLLDRLDELKLDLLGADIDNTSLDKLAMLLSSAGDSGEEGLDALLGDISLRAHVELAKRGRFLA